MIDMEKFPVLKSLNRFIITFFFVMGVTFSMVAPFSIVHAENSIYLYVDVGEGSGVYTGFDFVLSGQHYKQFISNYKNPHIYFTYVFTSSSYSNYSEVVFSDSSENFQMAGGNSWNHTTPSTKSLTYDEETGLYYYVSRSNYSLTKMEDVSNYVILGNATSLSNIELFHYVLDLENPFGNINQTEYGNIKDLSYSTNIVGSGTTTGDANIDTISWYPYWDTNSNISTTWNMQIQVVPGTWQGNTATDIFSQSYQDFIINESGALDIYRGTYLNGSYSISWGEVKNKLSILSWADLFQYFDGSYWNKKGWVYRARFNDPDNDYWSEWQTVYTITSSAGEGVEEFIDPSDGTGLPDFYNNAVDSYNTTSIVNNNNNITYYYVNTPVDTNPSSDDSTQYLKEIRDTIIQIRRMIALDHNADSTPNNDNDPWHGNPAAELYDFEDSSINDFNDAVEGLPTSDLVTGNKFLAASTWVRTQYETLVSNTPIEAVIIFSLLLGFGLLLIGKLR